MALPALLSELEALREVEKAARETLDHMDGNYVPAWQRDDYLALGESMQALDTADAQLIVAAVNCLPALLAIAEAAAEYDAAGWVALPGGISDPEATRLRAALASLPNAKDDRGAASSVELREHLTAGGSEIDDNSSEIPK